MKALFLGDFGGRIAPLVLDKVTETLDPTVLLDIGDNQRLIPALAEADQGMRFEQMSYTFSTISALGLESILPLLASTSFDAEILRGAKARPSQPTRALSTLI